MSQTVERRREARRFGLVGRRLSRRHRDGEEPAPVILVAKVGTSSVTTPEGQVDKAAVTKLCTEVAALRARDQQVVLVTSGAIAAGLPALGFPASAAGCDLATLQAVSAVGQSRLMRVYDDTLSGLGLVAGQVLLAPLDFVHRQQYLHARQTLTRLLDLGVVPVVNENDAVADDEIRFGDNDRLAALVAHLVGADLLVLLTDAPGLLSADPRRDPTASLIEEVAEVDEQLERAAGGAGTRRASGGMASKLAAARIAAWSGVEVVIAAADRPGVLSAAVLHQPGIGTLVRARPRRLPARKLWIAFAVPSLGTIVVDSGARRAMTEQGTSLLPAGVVGIRGDFEADDAVEIVDAGGRVFAKGLARLPASRAPDWLGKRTGDLPGDLAHEVVHRDDLVVLD
jgi:glutamate 5-kinase